MTDPNVTHCFECATEAPLTTCWTCGGYFCWNHAPLSWHFCHGVDWETMTDFEGAAQ